MIVNEANDKFARLRVNGEHFISISDLLYFIKENEIPDDTEISIAYEQCCGTIPSQLFYDKKTKEFCIME